MISLDFRKLTPGFGAEVRVTDAARLDEAAFGALRDLWVEHGILLFRDQELSEGAQVALSRRFGELEIHVRTEYLSPDCPEILLVSNMQKADGTALGILSDRVVGWHYDQIYLPRPALGSMLYAAKVPPDGGRTYFADMAAVYEALPDDLKQRIEGRGHMIRPGIHRPGAGAEVILAPEIAAGAESSDAPLTAALERLPEAQRQAFSLLKLEGLSVAAAAARVSAGIRPDPPPPTRRRRPSPPPL